MFLKEKKMKLLEILLLINFLTKMKLKKSIIICMLFFNSILCLSQESKSISSQQIIWYTYNFDFSIGSKWKVTSDIQERHFLNPSTQHLWAIRTIFKRDIGNQWDIGFGGSLFCQSTNVPEGSLNPTIPEIRPHIELNNKQRLWKGILSNRYRFESRFYKNLEGDELADEFAFRNFRFRYQIAYSISLIKNKLTTDEVLTLKVNDEIMLNFGNQIVNNIFDQNRIYIGLNYKISDNVAFEAGYLDVFQQQLKAGFFYDRNIIRLTLFHKLN
jgi:hypothetical protein